MAEAAGSLMGSSATRQIMVTRPEGLHARPCVAIAMTVRRFQSHVEVAANGQRVSGTDVLQLLSLGVGPGRTVTLTAEGPDAEEALNALVQLFESNFGLNGHAGGH